MTTQTPIQIHKTHTAKFLPAREDDPPGFFRALISVFGVKDFHGDTVMAGAFTKTIHEWALKGRPVPVVFSHGFHDLDNFVGEYVELVETDKGFEMAGQLDLDHPRAARLHRLMDRQIITEFSWSGEVREYEFDDDDDGDSWFPGIKILDVDLWEAGPTFKGANPETELLSLKSSGEFRARMHAASKAGRVLSKSNYDALVKARDEISRVLDSAAVEDSEPVEDDTESTGGDSTTETGEKTAKMNTEPGDEGSGQTIRALLELCAYPLREEN